MEQIEMAELRNMAGQNGLVFQDCDMAPQELLDLINKVLTYGGILLDQSELKEVKSFQHDRTVDLIIPFDDARLEPAKLVMWQVLTYHDCHGVFLSDYIQHKLREVQEETSTPQFGSMQM